MTEGLKLHASIPWTLVAMAALGIAFMYRDVQHHQEEINELKAALQSGVSQASIAELKARLDGQNARLNDVMERTGRLERSKDWERYRREREPGATTP